MRYTVCYMLTGGIDIDVDSEEEAAAAFEETDPEELVENAGEFSITEIIKNND